LTDPLRDVPNEINGVAASGALESLQNQNVSVAFAFDLVEVLNKEDGSRATPSRPGLSPGRCRKVLWTVVGSETPDGRDV